jgi:hypothetical protein
MAAEPAPFSGMFEPSVKIRCSEFDFELSICDWTIDFMSSFFIFKFKIESKKSSQGLMI